MTQINSVCENPRVLVDAWNEHKQSDDGDYVSLMDQVFDNKGFNADYLKSCLELIEPAQVDDFMADIEYIASDVPIENAERTKTTITSLFVIPVSGPAARVSEFASAPKSMGALSKIVKDSHLIAEKARAVVYPFSLSISDLDLLTPQDICDLTDGSMRLLNAADGKPMDRKIFDNLVAKFSKMPAFRGSQSSKGANIASRIMIGVQYLEVPMGKDSAADYKGLIRVHEYDDEDRALVLQGAREAFEKSIEERVREDGISVSAPVPWLHARKALIKGHIESMIYLHGRSVMETFMRRDMKISVKETPDAVEVVGKILSREMFKFKFAGKNLRGYRDELISELRKL